MDKVANKPDMLNASEWREVNKQLGNDISEFDKYNADTDWLELCFVQVFPKIIPCHCPVVVLRTIIVLLTRSGS